MILYKHKTLLFIIRVMEAQVKDSQSRCDEVEMNALKGGKKAVHKMESRIRELESELDAENR